jgi:hypothetical protein
LARGQHSVVVAVDHEHGHVDHRQIGAKVGLPRGDACHRGGGRRGRSQVPAGLEGLVADEGVPQVGEVVELLQEALHPRRGVALGGLGEALEHAGGHAVGVVVGLQQERWNRSHEDAAGDTRGAVPSQVARHLAGAHGVADEGDVSQVQGLEEQAQVLGEGVVVVTLVGWLDCPKPRRS